MPKAAAAARKRRKEILQSSRGAAAVVDTDDMPPLDLPPEMDAATEAAAAAAAVAAADTIGADSLPVKKRQRKSTGAAGAAAGADDDEAAAGDNDDVVVLAANARKQTKCTKTGKTMNTYEPDVEMTKEQLTAWRREARRVRNRESAAASRMKTKNRITELEKEVNAYKQKYEAAMQKLAEYEGEGEALWSTHVVFGVVLIVRICKSLNSS